MTHQDKTPDPARIEGFGELSRQLEFERKAAPLIVDMLLASTTRTGWQKLAAHPDLLNYGAIKYLHGLFDRFINKDLEHAYDIARLSLALAKRIPPAYPRAIITQMRAFSWKNIGKYYRMKGRYADALRVFRTAERMLGGRITLSHDLAIIRFNLAVTLQQLDRYNESLELLAECKITFRDHADTRNMTLVAFAQGVLLQLMKRYREAREVYLLIVATTPDLDDEQLAALNNTIGLCSIELGDWGAAVDAFDYAELLFSELDQPLSALNVSAGRGRLLIRAGEYALGISHLRTLRRKFTNFGLTEEAGLAGLEIVEGLIGLKKYSAAESLARKIIYELESAGFNKRAIQALSYLTRILHEKTATGSNVQTIRDYIVSLRTTPERDFPLPA